MNVKTYVWALLCLYLSLPTLQAQTLKVGDSLPAELWSMPLQVVNHPEGKATITLEEYKDKLIILDFWATWCSPCIKSLNKLDTIQKELGDKLAVVPITYENAEKVMPFLTKRGYQLPSIINDSTLKNYFPHRSIPHQVWVKDGAVLAVTGAEYSTRENIGKAILGTSLNFIEKNEVYFDKTKPLFLNGNGGNGSGMLYQSVISGRLDAMISGINNGPNFIMAYNQTVAQLYKIALADLIPSLYADKYIIYQMDSSVKERLILPESILKIKDGMMPETLSQWLDRNLYCYSLTLPVKYEPAILRQKMLSDLNVFFSQTLNLQVMYKPVVTEALVLERSVPSSQLISQKEEVIRKWHDGGSKLVLQCQPISVLLHYVQVGLKSNLLPVKDETGLKGAIDITLYSKDFKDLNSLKLALESIGLTLTRKRTEVMMAIYTNNDSKKPNDI